MFRAVWLSCVLFSCLLAGDLTVQAAEGDCARSGPQAPRDITHKAGVNTTYFSIAPPAHRLNLCNIHFHKNAEHKGPDYAVSGGSGKHGGWKCNADIQSQQKASALAPLTAATSGCANVVPGDTVEVHWVFSSCHVPPGKGLGACFSPECKNPQARVESAVYLLVNDTEALNFGQFDYDETTGQPYHQPRTLPNATDAVEFLGSTTGPDFTEQVCSPYQVTWNVRPQCQPLNINTLHRWCANNVFEEKGAHGVRQLVTNVKLMAPIR